MVFYTKLQSKNFRDFNMHMENLPKNGQFLFLKNGILTRAYNFKSQIFSNFHSSLTKFLCEFLSFLRLYFMILYVFTHVVIINNTPVEQLNESGEQHEEKNNLMSPSLLNCTSYTIPIMPSHG